MVPRQYQVVFLVWVGSKQDKDLEGEKGKLNMTESEQTQYQWYRHREERGIGMSGGELLNRSEPDAGCRALKMRINPYRTNVENMVSS